MYVVRLDVPVVSQSFNQSVSQLVIHSVSHLVIQSFSHLVSHKSISWVVLPSG